MCCLGMPFKLPLALLHVAIGLTHAVLACTFTVWGLMV
jgi:hypothetical protein